MSTQIPERILVCDDDAPFRRRLARSLRDRGIEVYEAENTTSGLEAFRDYSPEGVVVDLRMPGESGLSLVSAISELNPAVKIVVLTGFGSIATALEAVRRGAIHYITKPATVSQILASFNPDAAASPDESALPSLAEVESEYVHRVLDEFGGNVSQTAKVLGVHRRSLQRKLRR